MGSFHVELKKVVDDSYDIEIGRNLFDSLMNDLKNNMVKGVYRYAIITDSTVEKLYGQKLYELMKENDFNVDLFVFPAGEKSKTRETKAYLEDEMLKKGFLRDSCVIAIGGGVVTDIAGFLAGTFGRGIPFINYATTILAAADASVGGKTAVDTELATNLIGLINQPVKVYIDVETWKTLPERQVANGLAETIKHACLADKKFFEYLEGNIEKIVDKDKNVILDPDVCKKISEKNCEIKYQVVQKDEHEANLRQVLNLGHTVGRAIETVSNYRLLHGEAVSIGMAAQVRMGYKLGYITEEEMNRVIALYDRINLPTTIPDYVKDEDLVKKLYTDKKVKKGVIRFVFQHGIGDVEVFEDGKYSTPISEEFVYEAIKDMR